MRKYLLYNQGVRENGLATNQKVGCSNHSGRTKNSIKINKLGLSTGNEADAFFAGMPESMPTPSHESGVPLSRNAGREMPDRIELGHHIDGSCRAI